jgi:hypothetical protein
MLGRWGVRWEARSGPPDPNERIAPAAIERARYESWRPGPALACRIGDPRVLTAARVSGSMTNEEV